MPTWVRELTADYGYDAVDTCAVDGMCATACPVSINTGDLVKRLRAERNGPATRAGWRVRGQTLGHHQPHPRAWTHLGHEASAHRARRREPGGANGPRRPTESRSGTVTYLAAAPCDDRAEPTIRTRSICPRASARCSLRPTAVRA